MNCRNSYEQSFGNTKDDVENKYIIFPFPSNYEFIQKQYLQTATTVYVLC